MLDNAPRGSCWIAEKRTASGELTYDLTRFPHGMKWLADQAHSRQLKLGLYAAASIETCRQSPGSQGYEEVDAKTFAEWGADFAKLDSCGGTLPNGTESWYHQYGPHFAPTPEHCKLRLAWEVTRRLRAHAKDVDGLMTGHAKCVRKLEGYQQ